MSSYFPSSERHIQHQDTDPDLLSYRSAARVADCSVSTIRRLVRSGRVRPVYLTPDTPRIPRGELEKLAQGGAA